MPPPRRDPISATLELCRESAMYRENETDDPSHRFWTHPVTESADGYTVPVMKDTGGDLEDLVMTSSLVCVANGSSDGGHSTENSRPKSCETVIPVPSPSVSSTLWDASPLITEPPGRTARPRSSRVTVNSRSCARALSLKVIHKTA